MALSFLESQLNPEIARCTAKSIANIFYTQQNDEDYTLERHNLIVSSLHTKIIQDHTKSFQRLLKAWGAGICHSHSTLDPHICSVILKHLNCETNETVDVLADFERAVRKANVDVGSKNVSEEIDELYAKRTARESRKNFIREFDREKLGDFAVQAAPAFQIDENFLLNQSDEIEIFVEKGGKGFLLTENERKQQVLLGYSVINLRKAIQQPDLLREILRRCSKENRLLPVERDFIYYLWGNFESIPRDLQNELCTKFGFVYEKPILKVCVAALKTGQIVAADDVLGKTKTLPELFNKIAAIFCDLYFLSGRNKKIIEVYKHFFLD